MDKRLKMKNKKEFIELIAKYQSYSLQDLEQVYEEMFNDNEYPDPEDVLNTLTGFGCKSDCSLCRAVRNRDGDVDCSECVWCFDSGENYFNYCCREIHKPTYFAIEEATDMNELHIAVQNRAKYMTKWLEIKLKNFDELSESEV